MGEHKRIVLLSVAEGDDKPIKYPVIFRNCDAVILTKTDYLSYVDFKIARAKSNIEALNVNAKIFSVSSLTGEGMEEWIDWLEQSLVEYKQKSCANHNVKNLNSHVEVHTSSAHI